jgi:hypothetical protein
VTADDATLIATLAGVLIPLLVGLLTKLEAAAGVKATLNAGLCGLSGVLATIVPEGMDWNWRTFLVKWATAWVVSIATYAGLLKPTGVAPAVQRSTAGVGIG